MTRRLPSAVALCAALVLTLPAAAPAQQTLDWQPCGGAFQCSTLTVPRDYGEPGGPTFALPVVRKPATGPGERIGSLFVNPGGPGGSGVDFLRAAAPMFADLNARFDLVSWDPRGVAGSEPAVDCGVVDQETEGGYSQPFATPLDPASEQALVKRVSAWVDGCAARSRAFMAHITTADTARDLDALRSAVGDERLTYLGFSYGTFIGATYTSLFPNRSRAIVLDGALDPDQNVNATTSSLREQSNGFERALDRFFTACAIDQAACGNFGGADPADAFDRLVDRAAANPLPAAGATNPRPVDGDDVLAGSTLAMYSKQLWPLLAKALADAQGGDGSAMRELTDAFYGRLPDGTYGPGTDQYFAVSALEASDEGPVETYLRAGRHAWALFPHAWWNSGYGELATPLWPVEPRGVFRGPFRHVGDRPALVVGTTFDPATPYAWARRMTAELGDARLVTMRGDGHTAYGGNSACIDAAVNAYLVDLVVPAAGTTCRQEVPFGAPTAAARRAAAASVSALIARPGLRPGRWTRR